MTPYVRSDCGPTRGNRINDVLEISFLIGRDAHVSPLPKDQPVGRDGGRLLPNGDIDEGPSGTNGLYGLVETGLYSCRIESHVRARAIAELTDPRDHVVFGGVQHVVSPELFREFLAPRRDL